MRQGNENMNTWNNNLNFQERRAVWFSYLDWEVLDTASADQFRKTVIPVVENCAELGLNTVILQVRPFADAVYRSHIFPWSHLLTGRQGADPGFDPLKIFLEEAHRQHLRVEAWVNPYRISLNSSLPAGGLCADHIALQHLQWIRKAGDGLYFDPALPQVRQLVTEGVMEIVREYPVDGIQFDDYFYPSDDPAFDESSYQALGRGQNLGDWRRENVNQLIRKVYQAVKAEKPQVEFGISPQANNQINLQQQFSDIPLWLSQPGYADYIMPQTYWGFAYEDAESGNRFGFRNIVREWENLSRAAGVKLYFGLGAYRIGAGDGSDATRDEWNCGHNLADQVRWLRRENAAGWAVFRYGSLYESGSLFDRERNCLAGTIKKAEEGNQNDRTD